MSWFGTDPAAELDVKIEEATSESIPNGEMDMAVAMEITDVIRSKKVPPKQAMRGLKKRLTKVYANPNTLAAVLKLSDVCVKNGGSHFLSEINSKEFIDYLVEYIFKVHYDVKNYTVYSSEAKYAIGTQILKLVKEWSLYVPGNTPGNFLAKAFSSLHNQGYEFPAVDAPLLENASNFVDSATPPDWIDGRECMICYTPFSVMNRKHHCRACGGVFCQTHSSKNLPLVSLGIMEPVRVCDDCYQIHKNAAGRGDKSNAPEPAQRGGISAADQDEDEELKRAIELSLQETGVQASFGGSERPPNPPPGHVTSTSTSASADNNEDESDEEMKAAIAASLAEFQQKNGSARDFAGSSQPSNTVFSAPEPEPESDFYSNIMPFNAGAYSSQGPSVSAPPTTGYQSSAPTGGENVPPFYQQNTSLQPQHTQNQMAPPPRRPVEDLTAQEEEDITLFVQLMGNTKNDPAKQANILYDQKLGELHSRVVRLKPKLNRALRASIEKYEFFLEMNNKINSITRLYDQFLDHKLNMAYNRHAISSPQQPQASGYGQQQFFVQRTNSEFQHQLPYQLPYQATGPSGVDVGVNVDVETRAPPNPVPEEHYGPAPQRIESQFQSPQKTGSSPTNTGSVSQQYTGTRISEAPVVSSQSIQHAAPTTPKRRESSAPYPAGNDGFEHNMGEASYTRNRDNKIPAYPQVPSSPPSDGLSDAESDAESVASRYPALEDKYSAENLSDEGAKAHASARFPSLNDLDLPKLDDEPLAGLKKVSTNDSRKFRAEPEPLIEL